MLANAAPVAVDDELIFNGFQQVNVAEGFHPAKYIEAGSAWYSSTDGSDQNALNPEWKQGPEAGFNPASGSEPGWSDAPQPAKFGFGDGNEATTVPIGHTTYYFYRNFDIAGSIPDKLQLSVLADDCAIVYINGTEVHRSRNWGIAAPQNAALCAAAVATADENEFFEFVVDTAYLYGSLKPTGNTIAVEVHQATVASSDIGFDLKLREGGLGLLANDFDPDDSLEELRVEVVNATNATPYGMLDVSSNGDVRFMPRRHDVIGQFTFTYRVVDDGDPEFPPAVSNVATATVNVLGCDCLPPLAFNDINVPEFTVHEDSDLLIDATSGPSGPRGVGVLANDIIPYWSPVLPFVVVPPASGGSVEFNGSTGGFVYRPGPNFHGVDSFTYAVQDGFNISNFATVEISVAAIDDIPMTVNDSYAVLAGTELAAVQHEVLIPRRATWSYFDELTNGSNSSPRETYPRDGTGNVWNSPGFNTTTSDPTIGVWKVGTGIFAQPLTGLGPLGSTFLRGTAATVTTDLFRRTFDLTAAEASSITTLLASTVYDDGIVVYVNGTEVFRNAMPALPAIVGPQTLATANPSEDYQLHELAIPVGLLNEGINTIAVEVHQNSPTSPDRGFDLSLYYVPPGAGGISVLANDFDIDHDTIEHVTLVSGTGPQNGTLLEFNPDGSFRYTPNEGFSGVDSFEYTNTANGQTSPPATVRITVLPNETNHFDVNADGAVDRGDVAILLANFGRGANATRAEGDLTGDGRVTLADAIALNSNFTPSQAPAADAAVARAATHRAAVDQCLDGVPRLANREFTDRAFALRSRRRSEREFRPASNAPPVPDSLPGEGIREVWRNSGRRLLPRD